VVPIYKGGDRSALTNYRPVSLTSLVCKQMEHVLAGYLRKCGIRMIGYTSDGMVLDRDTLAKVKSLQCARIKKTLWTRGSI